MLFVSTYATIDVLYAEHRLTLYADNEVLYPLTYVIIDVLYNEHFISEYPDNEVYIHLHMLT